MKVIKNFFNRYGWIICLILFCYAIYNKFIYNEEIHYDNGQKYITKHLFSKHEILLYHQKKDVVISRAVFNQGFFEGDTRIKDHLYLDTIQKFDSNGVIQSEEACHLLELDSIHHNYSLYKCQKTIYKNGSLSSANFEEYTIRNSSKGITTKLISKQQNGFKDYENGNCSKYSFYNSRGNLEVEVFAPFSSNDENEIVEKRLYIDGEYIKTKCFVPYSKVRGFINYKRYCLDNHEYKEKEFIDKEKTCFDK